MMSYSQKRDSSLDSLKFFLIVFVVFGHVLEEFGINNTLGCMRAMIYCFHMPTFVFLSGYFSKNVKPEKLFSSCLLPYFIFNTVYVFVFAKSFNILTPKYLYWYPLSLFFWRLLIITVKNKKRLLPVSFVIGLYAGYLPEADRFLSISRTIAFFPFFVAGCMFTEQEMNKLRGIPKWISLSGIIIGELIVIGLDHYKIMPVKMYELIECYKKTLGQRFDLHEEQGVLLRLCIYFIGFAMLFLIISLTRRNTRLSLTAAWGKRTLTILMLSGFFVKILFFVFVKTGFDYKGLSIKYQVLLTIVISFFTLYICGNKWIYDLYNKIFNYINYAKRNDAA